MSSSASSTPRAAGGGGCGNGGSQHTPPLPPAPHGNGHGQRQGGGGGGEHVRLMCSFGGRIMPRPGDHQLRYVGGETRIVSVPRAATFDALVAALAKVAPAHFPAGGPAPALRYQLPQDDLDALISITSDDDVDNLIEEIDRFREIAAASIKPPRLRLFLFASSPDQGAFGSVLSGAGTGDASSDQWFVDALNAPAPPPPIERGRSEASSIISEVPDYLFGLDTNSDEPSPVTGGSRPKVVDTEMAHPDDDALAPARGAAPPSPYATETAPWPAPPPPYMTQQVYYVPVRPVHYLDPSSQGGYMPGPVYHIVGGGGSEARGGDLYSTGGSVGGVYGVPHPMQPYPPMMYGHAPPPPGSVIYSSEGKPPPAAAEGGAHAA
uniref:PB1 domain-containing protein n=1 Tax=Leersia perrieri TaxID=77586 RepID=A0A0D9X096_9ORYZ